LVLAVVVRWGVDLDGKEMVTFQGRRFDSIVVFYNPGALVAGWEIFSCGGDGDRWDAG
tara:strand:- start:3871 stop:4044 length:174 start_codon:yes stop_codon:yes gene_type:complete